MRSAPLARYLLAAHHPVAVGGFPWVTLLVNLTRLVRHRAPGPAHRAPRAPRLPWLRPLLIVGFLGGWTTYSTLAVDATLLAKHGDVVTCLAYLAATVAGGLALVVVGPRARPEDGRP